jgi:ABC-type nitrate/sulfonate/bicarbonate transport system permease component
MAEAHKLQPTLMDVSVMRRSRVVRWYLGRERAILGSLSFVGLFLFWELGAALGWVSVYFFSSPSRIARAAFLEVQDPRLWNDLRVSGTEFLVGYAWAVVLGIPLGLLAGWYRNFNYLIDPWLNFLNSLPRVALLPLVVLWVGIDIWSKIVIVFLGAFFSIAMNTLYGVRTVDPRLLEVAASFVASQRRVFTTVVFPATVPFIIAGLRLGIGRALIGVIVGELYAANAGIGYMITVASNTLQTDRLFFGVILLTLMGVLGVELIRLVENRFQKWRPRVGAG